MRGIGLQGNEHSGAEVVDPTGCATRKMGHRCSVMSVSDTKFRDSTYVVCFKTKLVGE
jgi:hypothetical protein